VLVFRIKKERLKGDATMTKFNYTSNRPLALRTIIFLFAVSSVMIFAPRPVLADIIFIRTNGNGQLDPAPSTPRTFTGNVAQFDKTLRDLNDFDIDILVTNIPLMGNTSITLNERVFNNTNMTWLDYHFTLGTGGFGLQDFAESTGQNLGFRIDGANAPVNNGGNFINPPVLGPPFSLFLPVNLSWFAGNGVAPGTFTSFSVTIRVFDLLDGAADGSARFTLRQHATVPEPTTMFLLGTGLAGVVIKTRKRLKSRKSGQGSQ
jgi:hypothetical protein